MRDSNKILIAVPKGRILKDLTKVFDAIRLVPEDEFFNDKTRKMTFTTNFPDIDLIKVRSFDIATFVRLGACDLGVCGSDVLDEFSSKEVYDVLDLGIGKCRLCLAVDKGRNYDLGNMTHARVVTKYVNLTSKFFSSLGVQAEIIKLNGAIEIATKLGLSDFIVDLVDTGNTLRDNDMEISEEICNVSSKLIVNRASLKTKNARINEIIKLFTIS